MRNYKRTAIIILIFAILLPSLLSGCTNETFRISPLKSEDYDISIFFGSVDDPIAIDEMINKYNKESGVSIEAIVSETLRQDKRYLNRLLSSENPPAGFVITDEERLASLDDDTTRIINLSDLDSEIEFDAYPFRIDGYGFVLDKRLIPEIANNSNTEDFLADLRLATFAEWDTFVTVLNNYIRNNVVTTYKLNGKFYSLPNEKGKLISDVNGVFAYSGSDDLMNERILNVLFSNIDLASDDNIELEKPIITSGLSTYFDFLDMMTSNLAGRFATGIRGKDLMNEDKFGADQVLEIFGKGKSVFTIAGTEDYQKLNEINAERAINLALIPIKFPEDIDGISEKRDGRFVNVSIPITASYYLYANATVDSEQQEMLTDFIKWLHKYDSKNTSILKTSVLNYLDEGHVFPEVSDASILSLFYNIENDRLLNSFLVTTVWESQLKTSFIDTLTNSWVESR